MGRRPKYARDGAFTRSTAPTETPAEAASKLRGPVSGERRNLEGWPPSFYCYACHVRNYSAQDIRDGYCEQCHAFLEELEQTYLSAAGKKVPKA